MRISSTTRGMKLPRTRLSGGGSSLPAPSADPDPAASPAASGQPQANGGGGQSAAGGQSQTNNGNGRSAANSGQTASNKQQQSGKAKERRPSKRAITTTLVLGGGAGATAAGIALLSGGGGQDDDRLRAQNQEKAQRSEPKISGNGNGGGNGNGNGGGNGNGNGGGNGNGNGGGGVSPPPPPAVVDNPLHANGQRLETANAEDKDKRDAPRDLTPTDVRVENNGQVIRGRVGNQDARLEITPTRTQLIVDNQPRGEFSTPALMDAAQRVQEGDTLRQARNNNLWGDLLKNPWFFVALGLAVYAFTRRR